MSSISSSGVRRSIRRLRPEGWTSRLQPRPRTALPYLHQTKQPAKLLLDTTVYIDELQGRLPPEIELSLRVSHLWHSTVTEAELAALAGLLDPSHPESPKVINQVFKTIERRPSHRILIPDRAVWREAGILAGTLARLQQYGKSERRRALNDALIFLSATKAGLAVLTRNVSEYDFLLQLFPGGKVLFYECA